VLITKHREKFLVWFYGPLMPCTLFITPLRSSSYRCFSWRGNHSIWSWESQNAEGKIEMFAGDGSQVTVIELHQKQIFPVCYVQMRLIKIFITLVRNRTLTPTLNNCASSGGKSGSGIGMTSPKQASWPDERKNIGGMWKPYFTPSKVKNWA